LKLSLARESLVFTGWEIKLWSGIRKVESLFRFLPFFFALGAALEFSMINWTVGETNFYSVYKKRQAIDYVEQKRREEQQQQ